MRKCVTGGPAILQSVRNKSSVNQRRHSNRRQSGGAVWLGYRRSHQERQGIRRKLEEELERPDRPESHRSQNRPVPSRFYPGRSQGKTKSARRNTAPKSAETQGIYFLLVAAQPQKRPPEPVLGHWPGCGLVLSWPDDHRCGPDHAVRG